MTVRERLGRVIATKQWSVSVLFQLAVQPFCFPMRHRPESEPRYLRLLNRTAGEACEQSRRGLPCGFLLTVQPSLLPQKPDLALRIASHQGHNDRFFFSSLEPIYTAQFDTRECLFERREYRKLDSLLAVCAA